MGSYFNKSSLLENNYSIDLLFRIDKKKFYPKFVVLVYLLKHNKEISIRAYKITII